MFNNLTDAISWWLLSVICKFFVIFCHDIILISPWSELVLSTDNHCFMFNLRKHTQIYNRVLLSAILINWLELTSVGEHSAFIPFTFYPQDASKMIRRGTMRVHILTSYYAMLWDSWFTICKSVLLSLVNKLTMIHFLMRFISALFVRCQPQFSRRT